MNKINEDVTRRGEEKRESSALKVQNTHEVAAEQYQAWMIFKTKRLHESERYNK